MENDIVYQGKLDNHEALTIRYPKSSDAENMTNYINELSDEKTFITYQGEHESLEDETKFLNSKLQSIKDGNSVFLLAYVASNLIGIAGVDLGKRTGKHVGILGISIAKGYRGLGIGKLLMKALLDESKKRLINLEIIKLGVFARNTTAINWYEKLGFVEAGRLPKGVKLENGYDDHIDMYMVVK